jgi:hypothetical protein
MLHAVRQRVRPLSLWAVKKLDQDQEPEGTGCNTGYRRGLLIVTAMHALLMERV